MKPTAVPRLARAPPTSVNPGTRRRKATFHLSVSRLLHPHLPNALCWRREEAGAGRAGGARLFTVENWLGVSPCPGPADGPGALAPPPAELLIN